METEPVKVVVRVRPSLDSESSATCLRINTLEQSLSVRDPEKHSYAQTPSRTPARTPRGCRTAPRQPAVVSTGEGRSQRPRPRLSFAPSADARTPRAPKTPRSAASLWTTFTFDKVLDDSTSQEEMYEHVEPYVADSVAGYNCTVFAYGYAASASLITPLHTRLYLTLPFYLSLQFLFLSLSLSLHLSLSRSILNLPACLRHTKRVTH